MITISATDYEAMIAFARAQLPHEACGLLAGQRRQDGVTEIGKVYLMTNTDHDSEHFSIDPVEHLAAVKDMRSLGLKPLGNWHSHPSSPARPSEEDKRLANDSKALYLILSLENEPVLKAFRIEKSVDGAKTATQEDLSVI